MNIFGEQFKPWTREEALKLSRLNIDTYKGKWPCNRCGSNIKKVSDKSCADCNKPD